MDSGEVIPGLNEDWTFAGAKAMEWIAGLVMMLVVSELFLEKPATAMPLLVTTLIVTALTLATLRRQFPDEERGLRNFVMTKLGFSPPGIPAPAAMQPLWSGAPMRQLPPLCRFNRLGLQELWEAPSEEFEGE